MLVKVPHLKDQKLMLSTDKLEIVSLCEYLHLVHVIIYKDY
jgi:hypothetical protein